MIAVPGAAMAIGGGENEVEQDDIDAYTDQNDIIKNENDFYFYGSGESYDENAWTGANCQLIVVADAWVGSLTVASALGVLDDSDTSRLLVGDLFPFSREGGWIDLDAESSTSSCDQSIGPVDIFVAADDGWDDPAPLGGTVAEAGEAAAASRGGTENEIEQEESEAESYQSDVISNENYADYEYLDESALASANCQAIIAAHVGVWSVAVVALDATLLDTDDSVAVIGDEPFNGPAESTSVEGDAQLDRNGLSVNLTIDNDTTAGASCAQPIESITISIGGRDELPAQS